MTRILSRQMFCWLLCVLGPSPVLAALPVPEKPVNADLWSLKPVVRPPLPEGAEDHPVDRFLNHELRKRGIQPVGPAPRPALLRRVHLDLTGLPPTPEEQAAFAADGSPDAYEKVVDRLLASEQHGVRYARHWLDVLRYADADERMTAAPGIHLWRDWVIHALNDDVPYHEFVQLQLTGHRADERTQMSATGYRSRREPRPGDEFALGLLARGAGENPQDLAISATDTVSEAFLGMTVSCAKCHDHMYDPVSQRDYYAMKALFDPLVLRKITLASADELMAHGKAMAELEKKRGPLEKELNDFVSPYKAKLYEERVFMLPAEIQAVIRRPEKERSVAEQKIADDYYPILRIDGDKLNESMPEAARRKMQELQDRVNQAGQGMDRRPPLPVFYTVENDRLRGQEKSYVLTSGDPSRPDLQQEVEPGWPFAKGDPDFRDGRIEAFADWLTAPENPLFARVAVNRVWQWHFGEGLLRNSSDFGELGGTPSHPALLDWLAAEFQERGYSMKQMHRLIVTSEAYRRASEAGQDSAENLNLDPEDRMLWHFPLRRLEAEAVWDSLHAASGELDAQVGGRSFDPRGGRGADRRGRDSADGSAGKKRRGAYIVRGFSSSRNVTPDFLQSFDVDDGRAPCPLRTQTVTAPQALFLMNSPEVDKACDTFAERLVRETGGALPPAVALAWRLTLSREPSADEKFRALDYLENDPARLKPLSWLLFNLDEFLYVR